MTKFGFSNYLSDISSEYLAHDAKVFQEFDSRLWGISDPVQAALYGYHLPPWVDGSDGSGTGKIETIRDLPSAEQAALIGRSGSASGDIPAGGCVGQARQEEAAAGLTSGGKTPNLVNQLQVQSFNQAKSDPRVLKVFASWSACMRQSGYSLSSPLAANFNMNAPATPLEIGTAKADVACKLKTNLLGVTYAVDADYQNTLIESHAQQLAQVQDQVRSEQRALASVEKKYGVS